MGWLVGAVGIELRFIISKPLYFQRITDTHIKPIRTKKDQSDRLWGKPRNVLSSIVSCIVSSTFQAGVRQPFCLRAFFYLRGFLPPFVVLNQFEVLCSVNRYEVQGRKWTRLAPKIHQRKLEYQKWSPKL
jgi:hypothetical protein